jgi:hypothetical protein
MTVYRDFGGVIDAVHENGGGTYYLSLQRGGRLILGDAEFKDGYYVALPDRERQVAYPFSLDAIVIADYIADNLELLRESDNYLGFWVAPNSGRVYLDVSKHVKDRERAIQYGIGWRQDAIYDIDAKEEIGLR